MWDATLYDTTKRTIELREIVESGIDIFNHSTIITAGYYPKPKEGGKMFFDGLRQQKLLNHYWFRQIGQETVGRFLHMFGTKLSEVVPHYEELYDSVLLMWELDNPFDNVDVEETFEQTTNREATATGKVTNSGDSYETGTDAVTKRFSNTPQGEISNIERYMTEASADNANRSNRTTNNASSNSEDSSEGTETTRHTFRKKGNQGVNTYAHDINEFRTSIMRIEEQFIAEFNCLFLGVY